MSSLLRIIVTTIVLLLLVCPELKADGGGGAGGCFCPTGYTINGIRWCSYSGYKSNIIMERFMERIESKRNRSSSSSSSSSRKYTMSAQRQALLQRPHSVKTQSAPHEFNQSYANVDMLLGRLFFTTTDFYLEGRDGIDLEVSRVHTSYIQEIGESSEWYDLEFGDDIQSGYFGEGWWWNLGRIGKDTTIYYGNGSSEKPMQNYGGYSYYLKTTSFELLSTSPIEIDTNVVEINGDDTTYSYDVKPDNEQTPDILYKKDGIKYKYAHAYNGTKSSLKGKYLTKIENPNNSSFILATYLENSPLLDTVFQCLYVSSDEADTISRKIWFEYSDTTEDSLLTARLTKIHYYEPFAKRLSF